MENIQDDQEGGFIGRNRIKVSIIILVLIGVGILVGTKGGEKAAHRPPAPRIVSITVPPPPPPPPPSRPRDPRPEPPPQANQMISQEAIAEPDNSEPQDAPSGEAPLGTGIVGSGAPDGFGLGTAPGGGSRYGGTGTRSGGPGTVWGRYGYQVQNSIQNALAANPKTRALELETRLRVWVDVNGRIERISLPRSVPADAHAAIQEVLIGLQLRQSAPKDMPQPIVLRLDARRPV